MRVKICGLTRSEDIAAAVRGGADYLGFVFWPCSPRSISAARAACLAAEIGSDVTKVGLFVDPSDGDISAVLDCLPLDMLQLHGSETPDRVKEVRRRWGLPVMKAVPIGASEDLELLERYQACADQILVDAKPDTESALPGGNGLPFDWRIIDKFDWRTPWMLAGGLTAANVANARRLTGATQFDVSSGVEQAPGRKDANQISAFVTAAKGD